VTLGDTIHGYKTSYPTQEGLAATRDYNSSTRWATCSAPRKCRWAPEAFLAAGRGRHQGPLSRFQEGNGENAYSAAAEVRALIAASRAAPKSTVIGLAMAKHWPGEGAGGEAGIVYDAVTIKYHMIPWAGAIEANTGSIMRATPAARISIGRPWSRRQQADPRLPAQPDGLQGLITTDWLPSGTPWIQAANAGADVMGGRDRAQSAST